MADKTTGKRSRTAVVKARAEKARGPLTGFVDFIRTQGVIGLAVGLVLGGAAAVVVKSLVNNIVMPPIGLLLGSADGLNGLTWDLGKAGGGKEAVVYYGTFVNDLINFVIIALVIYLVIHWLKLDRLDKKKE